ncbi:MAG: hypothetical protein FWE08_04085 [Oscillospiraceae bacterium]|nr:hypothetical protein [Oscillospiraceae bacterium]
MTEEQVTKAILAFLTDNGWNIVTFDFPQSGSGKLLRPNNNVSEKNKGGLIPDIVAVKGGVCLFIENKDKLVVSDFRKVASLISDNQYTNDIAALLANYIVHKIYYGVGFPSDKWNKNAAANASLVDFVMGVRADKSVELLYHRPHENILP